MFSFALVAAGLLLALHIFKLLRAWRLNYVAAKASGFRVYIVPLYTHEMWWLLVNRPVMKLVKQLPTRWQPSWLEKAQIYHNFYAQYGAFKGSEDVDTYMTSSPKGNSLHTANPEFIVQIGARRSGFPKHVKIYHGLNDYGDNVVTTEGEEWRRHRKTTAPSFNEESNRLMWTECIRQGQLLMRQWMGASEDESKTITTLKFDCFRVTLHIMAGAGFNIPMRWPGLEDEPKQSVDTPRNEGPKSDRKPHKLTQYDSLREVITSFMWFVVLGPKMLRLLPFAKPQSIYEAFDEWGRYMEELLIDKRAELATSGDKADGLDLMRALIRGADAAKGDSLTDAEILSDTYILLVAGHDSTASAVHFALTFLAAYPDSQRRLQAELDAALGGRPLATWATDYDGVLPRLFGGMAGAVLNETLRLMPPVPLIPKYTEAPQTLTLAAREGQPERRFVVPPHTHVGLAVSAVARNKKYWPHGPPSDPAKPVHPESNTDSDLEEFRPERWLPTGVQPGAVDAAPAADPVFSADHDSSDTATTLFRPTAGAYIPFSVGQRACLGRRFAQIEVLALLAIIFQNYSVELAVDQWASDEELVQMTPTERQATWQKAKDDVLRMLRVNAYPTITLQLMDGKNVPIRLVKRGKERFNRP